MHLYSRAGGRRLLLAERPIGCGDFNARRRQKKEGRADRDKLQLSKPPPPHPSAERKEREEGTEGKCRAACIEARILTLPQAAFSTGG